MTSFDKEGSPELEFWFEFGSNYSYLSVMRIEALAAQQGVRIVWKPFARPRLQAFRLEYFAIRIAEREGAVCMDGHGAPMRQIRFAVDASDGLSAQCAATDASRIDRRRSSLDSGVLQTHDATQFRSGPRNRHD